MGVPISAGRLCGNGENLTPEEVYLRHEREHKWLRDQIKGLQDERAETLRLLREYP